MERESNKDLSFITPGKTGGFANNSMFITD